MDVTGAIGAGTAATSMEKQLFGAQVVTKTLDYMNQDQFGKTNADYDFQKSVLSTLGIGRNINTTV